ncbi:MAG: PEGA domain-containing protein [Acidobacteria bacterium]|nr:PEGA domain-containing protein [Acidobacteriota bacterium]
MESIRRFARAVAAVALIAAVLPLAAGAQGRPGGQRQPSRPAPGAVARGPAPAWRQPSRPGQSSHLVFIGGYFYDPFYGPYPWWPRGVYPYPYFPVFDRRADVRLQVTPNSAAVYVDGFYAGIADDFDGVFQSLPLPPGGHTFAFFLEGHRTLVQSAYLRPGSTLKLHADLERLPAGERSELPVLAAPVPRPEQGVTTPRGTAPLPAPTAPPAAAADAFGTLELNVQPVTATVTIDGVRWLSSEAGRFVVDVPAGMHRLEVFEDGYARFTCDVDVRRDERLPLNVSLMRPF